MMNNTCVSVVKIAPFFFIYPQNLPSDGNRACPMFKTDFFTVRMEEGKGSDKSLKPV